MCEEIHKANLERIERIANFFQKAYYEIVLKL